MDVKVGVDDRYKSRQARFSDLRRLKHSLDSRFGNYSRLVQFCMVGTSGMVVDLTFYALFSGSCRSRLAGSKVGGFRRRRGIWPIAAGAVDRDRLGLEFHPEPASDFQRRPERILPRQFFTYVL